MWKNIVRSLLFILIGIIPYLLLILGYLYFDPFKVLYSYSDYSHPYVITNRDYISTEMFIKNNKKYHYNSFIFGSSRTIAFRIETWKKYLNSNDIPYMFDASAESIYGIYTKIKFLDSLDVKINNALIVICRDATFTNWKNQEGHLFIKHPASSNESLINFHKTFLMAYLDPVFLLRFYEYKMTGTYKDRMQGYLENRNILYDTITNEIHIIDQDIEISENPKEYYSKRKKIFYKRNCEIIDTVKRIEHQQVQMLNEIKRIFIKHNTSYKVIISPLYEQIKFSQNDRAILERVFGNNVFDFSGKNSFTDNYENYYETSHFRPNVGDSIIQYIYEEL